MVADSAASTETIGMHLVIFGMQNRTFDPCFVAGLPAALEAGIGSYSVDAAAMTVNVSLLGGAAGAAYLGDDFGCQIYHPGEVRPRVAPSRFMPLGVRV
jgi:hypothetical protein